MTPPSPRSPVRKSQLGPAQQSPHDGPAPCAQRPAPGCWLLAAGCWLLALEFRAFWEFGALLPAWPLLARAPKGDQHSVVVFPGLSASDGSTMPLRRYLDSLGYQTSGWEQGFNFGPRAGVLEAARVQVRHAFEGSGGKVSLIGWSLGGLYARERAKELPHMVRSVITLGTPFAGSHRSTNAWRIYELTSGRKVARESEARTCPAHRRCPPPAFTHAATASWPGEAASRNRRRTTCRQKTSKWWPATSAWT